MKKGKWVILSGISLILVAVILNSIYESIENSNKPEYSFSTDSFEPGASHTEMINLKGENEIAIDIAVKETGIPIEVQLKTHEGDKVGVFTSDKKFDIKIIKNPYRQGKFEVSTSNLGNKHTQVFVSVRDVKELGTYIETFEAWETITPFQTTAFWAGIFLLIIGVPFYFIEDKLKTRNKD